MENVVPMYQQQLGLKSFPLTTSPTRRTSLSTPTYSRGPTTLPKCDNDIWGDFTTQDQQRVSVINGHIGSRAQERVDNNPHCVSSVYQLDPESTAVSQQCRQRTLFLLWRCQTDLITVLPYSGGQSAFHYSTISSHPTSIRPLLRSDLKYVCQCIQLGHYAFRGQVKTEADAY